MPSQTEKKHIVYAKDLKEEQYWRNEIIETAASIDELLSETIKDPATLTDNERENYRYYREKIGLFEEKFKENSRQFPWGADKKYWPKDPDERAELEQQRAEAKKLAFQDELKLYEKDEKFIQGASLAKFLEADSKIVDRAADIIKEKQDEYEKTSPVARFFSYLNPFNNRYRQMRTEIENMKNKVAAVTHCKKKDLENFVQGKTEEVPFDNGSVYTYDNINKFLVDADAEKVNVSLGQKEAAFQNFRASITEEREEEKFYDELNAVLSDLDEEKPYIDPDDLNVNQRQNEKDLQGKQFG